MEMAHGGAERSAAGDPIPLSALQHAVYCLRQAALIHLERMWAENRYTAAGDILHVAANRPGQRRVRSVRRVSSLPVASARLGLAGIADMVEFVKTEDGRETPLPVEYKRGKPKAHRADEVQLCAQGLCLEEMFAVPVPEGALYYGETRRRVGVAFDAELREITERTAAELRAVLASGATPPPTPHKSRCRACSLLDLCRPAAVRRSAAAWTRRTLAEMLAAEADAPPELP